MKYTKTPQDCPRCGVRPSIQHPIEGMAIVGCGHCGLMAVEGSIKEAIDIWNGYKKCEKEENEMKDILELVDKIEELLKKSKFEWSMLYDPTDKAWTFQIKEK